MKIDMIICGDYVTTEAVRNATVIVVDVLRATSVIITALSNGAKSVVPVTSVEEALSTKKKLEGVVLGGERRAQKIEGFDLSNSPLEYKSEVIHDRNVVITTTNGTKAISKSSAASKIYIGGLLNAKAVSSKAIKNEKDIIIVNAGTNGVFSMDDFITGGAIIDELLSEQDYELTDIAKTALVIYRSHKDIKSYIKEATHYKILVELGLEEDIDYCLQKDLFNIVPEYKDGIIKLS
ncbi:MAG: 2-phosphosulfolactate phosphatase [Clostridiaceae bacterium]